MTVIRRKTSGMPAATNGDPGQTFDVAPGTGTQAINLTQAQADFYPIALVAPVPVDRLAALDALATAYLNSGPNTWTDYLVVGAAATTATDVSLNGVVVASLLAPSSGMSVITPPGSTLQLDTTLPGTWLRVTT